MMSESTVPCKLAYRAQSNSRGDSGRTVQKQQYPFPRQVSISGQLYEALMSQINPYSADKNILTILTGSPI